MYRRKGYYYEEEYKFKIILDIFYNGNNYYEDSPKFELAEALKIRVFPHYCIADKVNIMERKCYTNYSFSSIQKELEDTDLLDLHEHINEKIIGNNFNVKIYTKEFLNSSNPLYQCQNLYPLYNSSVNELIYIEYQYENKTFYKMYDYNEGHKFCEIGICYLYIVKNSSFIIYNDENLILNINDYLEPNILDNNTFIGFQFTNIDQGKLIEKTDNENEIITSSTNSLF